MASANEEKVATGLGWFSIGLGLAELLAPRQLANFIGLEDSKNQRNITLRLYGLREIAAGVGILSQPQAAGWVWARVAGDMLDLGSLGLAFTSSDASTGKLAAATAVVAGVTALDIFTAQRLAQSGNGFESGLVTATESVIINRSPDELYRFWRDFNNLPRFMDHLESVRVIDEKRSHWTVKTIAGKTVEWDAEITHDQPGSRIAWHSLEGAQVPNSGNVSFKPAAGNRGTVVRVEVEYAPPGGAITAKVSSLLKGEPAGQHIYQSLHALKQVLETGEVTKSDASIHEGMHPAQPPENAKAVAAGSGR
jgi:uncharacterized membrane protein